MSKNLDETVRLQSEIRQEWIKEVRGERLQGIAEGSTSASRLASSSAASFPERNECPGTQCSLKEQERENSSCLICHRVSGKRKNGGEGRVERTERELDRRRREMAYLLVLPRPAKSVQNGAGFSGKTGTYWACRKGKTGLSATKKAVGKYAGAAFVKRKRNRAVCPEYQIMRGKRVKMGEREGGSEREHEVERVDSTVKKDSKGERKGKQEDPP